MRQLHLLFLLFVLAGLSCNQTPQPQPPAQGGRYRVRTDSVHTVTLEHKVVKVHIEDWGKPISSAPVAEVHLWYSDPKGEPDQILEYMYPREPGDYGQLYLNFAHRKDGVMAVFLGDEGSMLRLENHQGSYSPLPDELKKEVEEQFRLGYQEVIPRLRRGDNIPEKLLSKFFAEGRGEFHHWERWQWMIHLYPPLP